jgi:hypothetical protein
MKAGHGLILGIAIGFGACYFWQRYKARSA